MSEIMQIKFWGVRGSYPVPGSQTVGYGGNTACVEVRMGGQTLIFDAGTGIIALGRELAGRARKEGVPPEATILFSHLHHDHIQGFPFFAPAYHPAARLYLFGPGVEEHALADALARNQRPPFFPVSLVEMAAAKDMRRLGESDELWLEAGGPVVRRGATAEGGAAPRVRVLRSAAHPGGVLLYRVEWRDRALVYATDTEGYRGGDTRLVQFARGADLLIHDAQYAEEHYRGELPGLPATQGWGHSTPEMACEVAAAAEVRRLALFHHDPGYDDAQIARLCERAQALFPQTLAAFEGLELALGESDAAQREAQPIASPALYG